MRDWTYDIETYGNTFTFGIISNDRKVERCFEVSEYLNEIDKVLACLDHLAKSGDRMFGFNNIGFDYPVIHDLMDSRGKLIGLNGREIAAFIFRLAQAQIDSGKGGFPRTIKESEQYIQQVDVYRIHHFDNRAKATSLKAIEFNMLSDTIVDLPYAIGKMLTQDEVAFLKEYNLHDIRKTLDFVLKSWDMIKFREVLTEKYGFSFMNYNDTKIGKEYFIMELNKAGIKTHDVQNGKRVLCQTKRAVIKLHDCLFNYYDFTYPQFQAVFKWFSEQRIRETKGVFNDLDESVLGDVAKYAELVEKRKKLKIHPETGEPESEGLALFYRLHPKGWIEKHELKAKKKGVTQYSLWFHWREAENLNVVVNGFKFVFGTGGIHGSLDGIIANETKSWCIVDADVESMYPNLGIANRVYPLHLTEKFCDIYTDVFTQRKSYAKGTPENAMLKLALNGVYGDSNNKFSPFLDPAYTMKITLNGQLSLCLLAEKLMIAIPSIKILQVNTDGITVAVRREDRELYNQVCADWQKQVGLKLEFADYSKMIIRDVNNYIAVYTNGKIKRKGAYQYEDLGWHQDQGGLIIPKAAEAHMLYGADISEFIRNHDNKWDFMLRVKVPRSSSLILIMDDGTVVPQQNICRYYPSKNGGTFQKNMPALADAETDNEREFSVAKGWKVKVCNNMLDYDGDLDYDYYIEQAQKLVVKPKAKTEVQNG